MCANIANLNQPVNDFQTRNFFPKKKKKRYNFCAAKRVITACGYVVLAMTLIVTDKLSRGMELQPDI